MNHRRNNSTMSNDGGRITFDEDEWLSGGSSEFVTLEEEEEEPGWRSAQITPIGFYYPLGPTRTTFPASQLEKTLETLPKTFKRLSLDAKFCEAPISASLRSIEEVELVVSLFESRRDPNQIILEVQRQAGDTVAFHKCAREILASVSGRALIRPSRVLNTPPMPTLKPDAEEEETVLKALELAHNMLKTDRYDAQHLGLEVLVHMSNPSKSGPSTAKTVTSILLSPTGPVEEHLSQILMEHACEEAQDLDEYDPFLCRAVRKDFGYLALVCLSQALALASPDEARRFLASSESDLVAGLLQKVHSPKSHPHEACFAVRCLTALCAALPKLKTRVKVVAGDIQNAKRCGDAQHLELARASRKLLVTLRA